MKQITFVITLCASLVGCTDRQPIGPTLTDDASWSPDIRVLASGYQRVGVELLEVPSFQIIRNLSSLVIEFQKSGEAQFSPLDTLNILRFVFSSYTSSPRLKQDASYLVRLSAEYKSGEVRKGNAVSVVSPAVRGKILRRIAHPQPIASAFYYSPSDIAFWQGKLFVLYGPTLVRVDTSSGNWSIVSNNIVQQFPDYHQMAFWQDTLLLAYQRIHEATTITLSWMNANSLAQYDEAMLTFSTEHYLRDLAFDGSTLFLLVQPRVSTGYQIIQLNAQTGTILKSSESLPAVHYIAATDGNLWIASNLPFDNRIRQVDPVTFSAQEEHQNPVFSTDHLAWDGANFWVLDYEAQTYTKIRLEGLPVR